MTGTANKIDNIANASTVQLRYDALRKSIPFVREPNILLVTSGIRHEFGNKIHDILKLVKNYDTFNQANDPWHEHDFGAFEFEGEKIFWKIDDYGGTDGYELILTVMLASEY